MSDAVNGSLDVAKVVSPAILTHGWIFLGMVVNVFLFGIMVTQTYLYFNTYVNDRLYIKVIVATLFVADTCNSVFGIVFLYDSLILNFNNAAFLRSTTIMFRTDPALTGLIAAIVQGFFGHRVWILTRSRVITAAIYALAITGAVTGVGTSINSGMMPLFSDFKSFQQWSVIWLFSAVAADFIITTTLVWSLRSRKTGFKGTDNLIDRIIFLTVQTGLLTAVIALVDVTTFLTVKTQLHLLFNMPLSKLYTNSLMSSLNARGGWKFSDTTGDVETVQQKRRAANLFLSRGTDASLAGNPGVLVTVEVEHHELSDRSNSEGKTTGREYDEEAYARDPAKLNLTLENHGR